MSTTNEQRCRKCSADCTGYAYWVGDSGPLCCQCSMEKMRFFATPYSGESMLLSRIAQLETELAEEKARIKRQSEELHKQQSLRALYEQYYRFAYTCKSNAEAVAAMASEVAELRQKLAEARKDSTPPCEVPNE